MLALPAETPFAPSNYSRGSGVHTAAVNGAKVITHTPCATYYGQGYGAHKPTMREAVPVQPLESVTITVKVPVALAVIV